MNFYIYIKKCIKFKTDIVAAKKFKARKIIGDRLFIMGKGIKDRILVWVDFQKYGKLLSCQNRFPHNLC